MGPDAQAGSQLQRGVDWEASGRRIWTAGI